jgi:hypothetical protein
MNTDQALMIVEQAAAAAALSRAQHVQVQEALNALKEALKKVSVQAPKAVS